jgi:hypothetical protein
MAVDIQQGHDRSLGELFAELSQETSTLVREEVALAKTELTQKATRIGKDVAFLAAGGAVAYAGLLTLIGMLVVLLAKGIPWVVSALIVGLLVSGAGVFLVFKGLNALQREDPVPHQTIDSLKESTQWAKQQTR